MRYLLLNVLALSLAVFMSCAKPPRAPEETAAVTSPEARLQQIPPADPQKYASMRDMKAWRNPYLIIRPDGVGLLDPANNEQRLLKPGELLNALAALPSTAWPYGRVVVVTENSLASSEEQRVAIRRNKGIVAGTLESMQILINWVPSA
jgi:hypothetical protein